MKYLIEQTLNNKFVVSEAKEYSVPNFREKKENGGFNIFGNKLQPIAYTMTHKEKRYVAGEAFSSSMTYNECLDFCKNNNLELIQIPLHVGFVTELDSRTFRK